eukprot:1193114-Prorocentrum_minimum.AAC.6
MLQVPVEPFVWVPREKDEDAHYLRPAAEQIPTRTETSLPLEFFDDPGQARSREHVGRIEFSGGTAAEQGLNGCVEP